VLVLKFVGQPYETSRLTVDFMRWPHGMIRIGAAAIDTFKFPDRWVG